jgi:hypothetical protein
MRCPHPPPPPPVSCRLPVPPHSCFISVVADSFVSTTGEEVGTKPPVQSLADFTRAQAVAAGESRTLTFTVQPDALQVVSVGGAFLSPASGSQYDVQCRGLGEAATTVRRLQVV